MSPSVPKTSLRRTDGEEDFQFPRPPEYIEPSIRREAAEWQNLDEFDAMVKLEECTGLEAEVVRVSMGPGMWGFTYTSRELKRCRSHLNSELPRFWQRFAFYHEVHHLLHDSRGCYFWSQTQANMNGFEYQADQFAWAVLMEDWTEDGGDE